MHGSGEKGNDIEILKRTGLPRVLEEKKDMLFIVVSPQCPKNTSWSANDLNKLLNEVGIKYRIDKERMYLTGISMGGFTTWYLSIKYPSKFAAIAPICGWGSPTLVYKIRKLPVWVFHGEKDNIVPAKKSKEMVDALQSCGGNVRFTLYTEAGHNFWTQTYNNPKLYEWFLQHKKWDIGGWFSPFTEISCCGLSLFTKSLNYF